MNQQKDYNFLWISHVRFELKTGGNENKWFEFGVVEQRRGNR
jgi:hypothetical protein